MITKWLRTIVANEVSKIETSTKEHVKGIVTSLENERLLTTSFISTHIKASLNGLNTEAERLLQDFEQKLIAEASLVVAEKNELIKELHEKVKSLEHTAAKITHWKADSDTITSDNNLKLVK